ncbi:hypothetical protein GDO86_017948, partial [Hymenochirus boettgeri]
QEEGKEDSSYCDTSLVMSVLALLVAGVDTTSLTIKFCLTFIAHFPDVQAKVQQEIDEVIGSQSLPKITDRAQMPYTSAVIHELQRLLDMTPIGLFHAVTEDVQFRGYTIPKGTTIITNLTSVLFDPSQWETPEEFNPGHFLDANGNFRAKSAFMAFSAGNRSCVGQVQVHMVLFLIFTSLLQKFTFRGPPGTAKLDCDYLRNHKGEVFSSEICAIPRNAM